MQCTDSDGVIDEFQDVDGGEDIIDPTEVEELQTVCREVRVGAL